MGRSATSWAANSRRSRALGDAALVTVLIGSNDIIKRDLRAQLPDCCRTMLPLLPAGTFVATVPRTRGVQAEVNRLAAAAEADGAVVAVPLHFAAGACAPTASHKASA